MKRVLVTGGSGWIGVNCLSPLLARGFEVHATYLRQDPPHVPGTRWHRFDVLDADARKQFMQDIRPTHLLHLAWNLTGQYREMPDNWSWAASSIDLLHQFIRSGGSRFIGAGTCLEYDWNGALCREMFASPAPSTPYGNAKKAVCEAARAASRIVDVSTAWVRIFFPFGPGEKKQRFVPSVVTALLKRNPLDCSDGTQIRDFISIQNLANVICAIAVSDLKGSFNVGSGVPMSLQDVAKAFSDRLGGHELIRFGRRNFGKFDNPNPVVADIQRLTREIAYHPSVSFEQAIDRTIDYWQSRS
jgi:nucleoside-diphosphate-sugar epimerase